jgi:hypothetical protein
MPIPTVPFVIFGRDSQGNPIALGLTDTGDDMPDGSPIYALSVDSVVTIAPGAITVGAIKVQDGAGLTEAVVAVSTAIVAADEALAVKDPAIGQVGDLLADGTVVGLLSDLASQSHPHLGVAGERVVSADASGAPVAITDAPGAGVNLHVHSVALSTAVGGMWVELMEETSLKVLHEIWLDNYGAAGLAVGNFELPTSNKRLMMQTDTPGKITATVIWDTV